MERKTSANALNKAKLTRRIVATTVQSSAKINYIND